MANRNFSNGGKIYIMETKPVMVTMNFTVTSTNAAGITNLKGATVANVFMHTSTTPVAGNPNPASGTILVQLQDNYRSLLDFKSAVIQSPNSGSAVKIDNAAMTAGVAYTITVLGDASLAKWQSIGLPIGVTPAVGVSFIATSDGGLANTSTSRVQASAAAGSGVASVEIVGNTNLAIAPNRLSGQSYGSQIILQCRDYAGALVAPADGSVISLTFMMSDSSVSVQGQ